MAPSWKLRSKTLTKPGKDRDTEATDRPAHDPARPASMSDMPYFSEALSLNPLLGNPAAAMSAATAIGFGFANQMASAFFGVMQGALETANRQRAAQEAEAAAAKAEAPVVAEPEVVQAPKAKAVRKPAAVKKAAAPAEPVPAPVKAVPAKPAAAKAKAAPKAAAKVEPKAVAKAPVKVKASAKSADGDLKTISGIGPKLESLLKDMGVTTIAQIAGWTDKDIARFDKELGFEGRIVRDDWVGQAKALLK
jgi:NADH-quinone oxidoreductase subunit E